MKDKITRNFVHEFRTNQFEVGRNHNVFTLLNFIALFCLLCVVFPVRNLQAQNKAEIVITGVVTDASGEPIPGTTVFVKGTTVGTITDFKGAYSLKVPANSNTIVFSFIGMTKQEIPISGSSRTFNVVLKNEELGLEEVVVVGYGTQKKETATGAISTVKSEDILKTSVSNVGNALVGLVPGISSVQFSGEPGSNAATIRIRGVSTLNGEGQDALVVIDGLQQSIEVLNAINPNDIASVSVLKDASATSIYGIRGANGVIIVTTKRGKTGKPSISISSDFGFTEARTLFKPVSSYEYALFRNEAILNDDNIDNTSPLYFTEDEIWKFQNNRDYTDAELEAMNLTSEQLAAAKASPALYYGSHDYFKDQYGGRAPQTEINLNVSGGNDKVSYFTSVGYFKQDGIINYDYYNTDLNSHYNRYNFRSNVDIKSIKNLTVSLNLSARFSSTAGAGVLNQEDDDRYWSINQWVMEASPFQGPGIRDGRLINGFVSTANPIKDTKGASGSAPLNTIFGQTIGTKSTSNVNTTLNLKYDLNYITKGLSVGSVLSYDDTYTKGSKKGTPVPRYSAMRNPKNPAEILYFGGAVGPIALEDNVSNFKTQSYYAEARISYDRVFGDHNISAVVIGNAQKKFNPDLQYRVPEGLMGLAARATYNYKEKYLGEINMAYNGSENFPESNRFGFFPSVSLGWVISNEPFLKDSKVISWLKIRGSYGIVGNDKIGGQRFLYLPSTWANFNPGSDQILEGYFFGVTNGSAYNPYYVGSYEDKLGNPVVTWEKAVKRNVSLESRFFEDKLSLTLELYNENRTNILWALGVVPQITGATFPPANIGEVYNKGYELELGWKDHIGKVNYFIKGYLAYAKNKIIYKDEAPYKYDWMNETGFSIGQYKGYKNVGFFNTDAEVNNRPYTSANGNSIRTGDLRYVDVNGDGIISASDRVPIGYSNLPLYSFSSTIGFSYKGFDISALFTGSAKGSITFQSENLSTPFFKEHGQAMQWQYDGRWTPEKVAAGITPTFPRAAFNNSSNNNGSSLSDFWMRPNDYIKLKNIEMGYSFQQLATKLGVSKIRLSLSANNVWLIKSSVIDGIDPEQLDAGYSVRGFIFPMTSAYMAGINIEF
jgi:TonB-linked SusC/RagA family outer membrane protein